MKAGTAYRAAGWDPTARLGLISLYSLALAAVVGYATFGLNPGLLARFPRLAGFYSISFSFFAQAQVWLAWAVFAAYLWRRSGSAWLAAFAALYGISLGGELLGTTSGFPFGEYRYTAALGPQWFGHVPILIPLSWFYMAVPSYALARIAVPERAVARALLASLILLAWDLALDPAMSGATAYWVWERPGSYYGMPWTNLMGWYVTGLALMLALVWLNGDRWIDTLSTRWLAAFYGANLLLPMGMSAAAGAWGAVFVTAGMLALVFGVARVLVRRPERIAAVVSP